ncbi:mucoidy inhibitor MuiA family protein [Ahrensia sp. 13_GOM-1096m]|uniref:mucoidy inhibitor MuiA family protein n=1 Tax=Ahrensia sp. 13_GOM-1096m TaxID=1380380 RepID=UPI00047A4402|nr:mucoidy inhibitor MuiA family protein [Ahrensia sp. 13_GOM-1096m]
MKTISLAILLSTTMLGSAFADEFKFSSAVDAVTVFPRGAEVERVATGEMKQGTHVVLIENLPADISADSVRVEGVSDGDISIGSVDVRQVYLSRNENPEDRLKIELQIEAHNDEHMRLDQAISDTDLQRSMLQNLISNAGKPNQGDASNVLSAFEVADLLDGAAQRLDAYAKRTIDARASQRDIQRQIQDLQGQIAQLAPNEELRSVVAINLDAKDAGQASFKIKYAIRDAGWQAVYDAELSLGDGTDPTMEIVRRANVRQSTAESWDNVALTLSTARPSTRTAAPDLSSFEINQIKPMARSASKVQALEDSVRLSYADVAEPEVLAVAAPMGNMAQQTAIMETGGYQATYAIAGKVTITNTGETKSVVMGEDNFDVDVSAYAVPRLDAAAYLIAGFTLKGDATYLPGPVLLSRDGAYIGRGQMPMLAPNDTHDLSFGQDDFVTVEFVETDKKEGETGLISASLTNERRAVTTIKNLHGFPMDVTIVDRLPVANHEDIKVAMLAGTTKPTQEDVDGKRGILHWDLNMEAGTATKVDFGYRVTWPKAMDVSPLN